VAGLRRAFAILTLVLLLIAATMGVYYNFVYLPEKRLEERIKPLMEARLTRETALKFDEAYGDWAPYNNTAAEYARYWASYPAFSEAILEISRSVRHTVLSLDLMVPNIVNKTLTQDTLIDFMVKHPFLVKDDGLNTTDVQLLKNYNDLPVLTDAVISSAPIQNLRLSILSTLYPLVKNQTIPEENASSFITKHKELALDDGINATDIQLMKSYIHLSGIVDKVIEKIKSQEDRLFALGELTLYISEPLTEEQACQLIGKWYPDLFEACKKEAIPVVFGDPDEDFVSNYDEIFKYGTDPLFGIGNFTWTPTKIVNNKVYYGSIFIRAKSIRGILSSKVYWIPINYTQFPKEVQLRAFPNETIKEFDLIPINQNLIEFFINMTDIKGGREYLLPLHILDKAGNTTREIKTPYIREFENIAPLDDILVGAFYYPWYDSEGRHWGEGYTGKPLLWRYYSGDEIVISKHVDWMTGHGIDFILPSWWGPNYAGWTGEPDRNFRIFLNSTLVNDIKFGINYETLGRLKYDIDQRGNIIINMSDPRNIRRLLNDFDYLSKTYFNHPSILKVDGKVFTFFYLGRCFTGDVKGAFESLRESLKKKGHAIYIVGDEVYWQNPVDPFWNNRIKFYDAITAYNMLESPEKVENFEELVDEKYDEWYEACRGLNVGFIPDIIPGYDDRAARPEAHNPVLPKNAERFQKQIEIAMKYITKKRIILITSFNEWHEYTSIEPSFEDSFSYLEILKKYIQTL